MSIEDRTAGDHIRRATERQEGDEMDKIFRTLRHWLQRVMAETACDDPVNRMSARERADLPVYHPRCDTAA